MNAIDTAAVRRIADQVRAIDPDDPDFLLDMIEGTTDALEIADRLIARIAELDALAEANKARIATIRERNARFDAGKDACRAALAKLLEAAGIRKLERPEATISIRHVPPSLIEGPLPSDPRFIRTKVEPDKAAIRKAMEAGEHVPGWALSNGGEGITLRRK